MNVPSLKKQYHEQVVPELMKARGYKNRHQVPRLEKIVINSGLKSNVEKAAIEETVREIGFVAGQRPVVVKARRSISNFKLREGMPIGVKVTLRGDRMYEFLHRLIAIGLPGIRDFRGVGTRLDGSGNYNLGIADHTIFPEATTDHSKRQIGMDVTIVTSAENDDEGRELIRLMGMPFRKR